MPGRNAYQQTVVPVARSQEQIRAMLQKYGSSGVNFSEDWNAGRVGFQFVTIRKTGTGEIPLVVRMVIQLWKSDSERLYATQARTEQRQRQVWRALYFYLKSQLEAVDFGLRTFEDAFLADIEMRDGRVLGDHVKAALDSGRLALPETAGVSR